MGQAAAIVINDGATTPVAVTFSPEKVTPEATVFVDRRKSSRALQPSITVGLRPASGSRNTYQGVFEVAVPIEGVVNGVAQPIGVARFKDGKFIIPDFTPAADRANLHAWTSNGMQNSLVKAVFKDLDPIY